MSLVHVAYFAALVTSVCSKAFLGGNPTAHQHMLPAVEVDFAIQRATQAGFGLSQVLSFEAELAVLYSTVPKNEHGRLEPATVRYVLHRFFAQKFHWHVTGLNPEKSPDASSPNLMTNRVPSYIQGLFEKNLNGNGMGLREVAVFAAVLLDLIHREIAVNMGQLSALLSERDFEPLKHYQSLINRYLVVFISAVPTTNHSYDEVRAMEEDLIQRVFIWRDAKIWAKDIQMTVELTQQSRRNPFREVDFLGQATEVAREFGHGWGSFQNKECLDMKGRLVEMEDEGTGRVPLSKFYSGIDDRKWPFIESIPYLRSLGVLDETDPGRVTVIIPNYIGSPSFCEFPSAYYGVCCQDECEEILAHVERAVGKPFAEPDHLARIVSDLGSDTVEAPRNLSSLQVSRLQEIAAVHGGTVALHGRLFAQWLHFAYPRECRFPHVSNTTNPVSQEDWAKMTGISAEISDAEIEEHRRTPEKERGSLPFEEATQWLEGEELIALHWEDSPRPQQSRVRLLAMVTAVASATIALMRASRSVWTGTGSGDVQKFAV